MSKSKERYELHQILHELHDYQLANIDNQYKIKNIERQNKLNVISREFSDNIELINELTEDELASISFGLGKQKSLLQLLNETKNARELSQSPQLQQQNIRGQSSIGSANSNISLLFPQQNQQDKQAQTKELLKSTKTQLSEIGELTLNFLPENHDDPITFLYAARQIRNTQCFFLETNDDEEAKRVFKKISQGKATSEEISEFCAGFLDQKIGENVSNNFYSQKVTDFLSNEKNLKNKEFFSENSLKKFEKYKSFLTNLNDYNQSFPQSQKHIFAIDDYKLAMGADFDMDERNKYMASKMIKLCKEHGITEGTVITGADHVGDIIREIKEQKPLMKFNANVNIVFNKNEELITRHHPICSLLPGAVLPSQKSYPPLKAPGDEMTVEGQILDLVYDKLVKAYEVIFDQHSLRNNTTIEPINVESKSQKLLEKPNQSFKLNVPSTRLEGDGAPPLIRSENNVNTSDLLREKKVDQPQKTKIKFFINMDALKRFAATAKKHNLLREKKLTNLKKQRLNFLLIWTH